MYIESNYVPTVINYNIHYCTQKEETHVFIDLVVQRSTRSRTLAAACKCYENLIFLLLINLKLFVVYFCYTKRKNLTLIIKLIETFVNYNYDFSTKLIFVLERVVK
uniref:Uncharacterized protein n=1 Tax=Glossina brevipalpis TaxID=37001 RepID=A0A1A9WB99_9MUSC